MIYGKILNKTGSGKAKGVSEDSRPTRLTVIDHTTNGQGVIVERRNVGVEVLPLQDDGRTLKIRLVDGEDSKPPLSVHDLSKNGTHIAAGNCWCLDDAKPNSRQQENGLEPKEPTRSQSFEEWLEQFKRQLGKRIIEYCDSEPVAVFDMAWVEAAITSAHRTEVERELRSIYGDVDTTVQEKYYWQGEGKPLKPIPARETHPIAERLEKRIIELKEMRERL